MISLRATLALALLSLGGCATTSLAPAPGDATEPGEPDVADATVAGITVTAQADAWTGDAAVTDAVQPVRVTVENGGRTPVRVRYGDFTLVGPASQRYAALPPFSVEGELASPLLADGYGPYGTPGFEYDDFEVAPYYAGLYPGMGVYGGDYDFYDPDYYGLYYQDWADTIRPTTEMLGLALPEGVIQPGGRVSGYLYFQPVAPGVPQVTFREDLVGVGTGSLGTVSIPFAVTTTK